MHRIDPKDIMARNLKLGYVEMSFNLLERKKKNFYRFVIEEARCCCAERKVALTLGAFSCCFGRCVALAGELFFVFSSTV